MKTIATKKQIKRDPNAIYTFETKGMQITIKVIVSEYGYRHPVAEVAGGTEFQRLATMHRIVAAAWDLFDEDEKAGGRDYRNWAIATSGDYFRAELEPCDGSVEADGIEIMRTAAARTACR